jgi:hypothetical protein
MCHIAGLSRGPAFSVVAAHSIAERVRRKLKALKIAPTIKIDRRSNIDGNGEWRESSRASHVE